MRTDVFPCMIMGALVLGRGCVRQRCRETERWRRTSRGDLKADGEHFRRERVMVSDTADLQEGEAWAVSPGCGHRQRGQSSKNLPPLCS